ncbi:MAG: transporter [Deltaproteobacteria bacterium]|nr:transporter [Deltaproteobacteria bacterium]
MAREKITSKITAPDERTSAKVGRTSQAHLVAIPDGSRCLDTVQLTRLEQDFRRWAAASHRDDVRLSRRRILLIFLFIRYTGAKLHEVLAVNPFQDVDHQRQTVSFGKSEASLGRGGREVQIPETLSQELQEALADPAFQEFLHSHLAVDPGHVRRKFYERALACGFPKALGAPDVIRRSRAVELMQNNLPLPVVQKMLGHSTPNLTASFVDFSEVEIQKAARFFLEKEARRKTSARNTFFGKISAIKKGDIQAQVELVTLAGDRLVTVITNDSLLRLGLKTGMLISAEVKAPWVVLQKGEEEPAGSAENRFRGTVERILKGRVTTEYRVRIADGTELCAVVSQAGSRGLELRPNDTVWAVFNCFAVVLHLD